MKRSSRHTRSLTAAATASLMMVACTTVPTATDGVENARIRLTKLQADPQLATRAPIAIGEAEGAVRAAEAASHKDPETVQHLLFIADRRIEIARAQAQTRLAEDQRAEFSAQRERARLDARTREADQAHVDTNQANMEAENARSQADLARMDAEASRQEVDDLQQQLAELNAKSTDRGLVITLGDVLFDTGKSGLRNGVGGSLDKLVDFLGRHGDRTVIVEGHTDSVGSAEANLGLSQRRADAVKSWLVARGVGAARLTAYGKGEEMPIADNDSAAGRQQNRRVEIIIANAATLAR